MTLTELHQMRKIRARPAMAIILTDDDRVHEFCAANDLPVIWTAQFPATVDLSPLHNLQVWLIPVAEHVDLAEKIRAHLPADLWISGYHGFTHRIGEAIGRPMWTS